MANVNRAVVFKELGACEQVLQLRHLPRPHISPGHVLVRIILRPVHHLDLDLCSERRLADTMFLDKELFRSRGAVAGHEGGLGIIEEIGEGVQSRHPGQRVHLNIYGAYFETQYLGSWQDYISIKEEYSIPIPDLIGDEVAAQFSVNPWTTYGLYNEIDVPKGEFILLTSAGSAISRLFIQLAKHEGHKIIGVVRRNDLKEEILALGADAVINNTLEDVVEEVMKITNGKGAYIGIDLVGGSSTKSVATSVRDGGQVWVIGTLESRDLVISVDDFLRRVQISVWVALPYFLEKEKYEAASSKSMELFSKGIWKLQPAIKFDLSEFNRAVQEIRKCGTHGKVLLESK